MIHIRSVTSDGENLNDGLTPFVVSYVVACHSNAKSTEGKTDEIPSARVATAQRGNLAHTLSLAGQFQPCQSTFTPKWLGSWKGSMSMEATGCTMGRLSRCFKFWS